jgi:uncharacterized protein YndB with AHSA1/START domain
MEFKYDWSNFNRRIPINAPVESIYNALATRNGMESWFLRKAEFKTSEGVLLDHTQKVKAKDTYNWYWHGWDDNTVEKGEILEANGIDKLSFTFGREGIVNIKIYVEDNETIVDLIQSQILTTEEGKVNYHLGCSVGWTFYLANLKSVLEGGLDLRNKNDNLKNVVSS